MSLSDKPKEENTKKKRYTLKGQTVLTKHYWSMGRV